MEYLIGLIVALGGGLYVLWRKLQGAKVEASLAETKGKDSILKEDQKEVDGLIAEMDKNIEEHKKKRAEEREKDKNLTLAERADRWGK